MGSKRKKQLAARRLVAIRWSKYKSKKESEANISRTELLAEPAHASSALADGPTSTLADRPTSTLSERPTSTLSDRLTSTLADASPASTAVKDSANKIFYYEEQTQTMGSLDSLCRICSEDLKEGGVGIFSTECMSNLIGEKIRRYLYFSVSMNDKLPKKVCQMCMKKLENIHKFARMAAQMQVKFNMLLSQEENGDIKPKIKIRSLEDLNGEIPPKEEITNTVIEHESEEEEEEEKEAESVEMAFEVAVEEVGENSQDIRIDETSSNITQLGQLSTVKQEAEETVEDPIENRDEKPNPSLLHSLLLQGKQRLSMDIDHDYLMPAIKDEAEEEEETNIKEEPEDPEDEDIAEEIEEDRLNQIIKDEIGSDTEDDDEGEEEEEEEVNSDVEVTEMEVKVDPMLYFSNASLSGNEVEQDSQDGNDPPRPKRILLAPKPTTSTSIVSVSVSAENGPLVMTRSQQKTNPVIASLKLGKPYKCSVCPRSFITDIGLQNHLWSHLPKSRKAGGKDTPMIHKNVDMEDSQVYSSNGVLHTAMPSENPHLLKYVCPICGKKISTKGNLKVHLETHRPKGKYGCDICGRVFKTSSNLYRHKDYHGGVQFPCLVCGRVYPTNSTLRAHSITHSDLRPHQCPLCSKTFKRNQDLKFHINQHTGARPYQCPYCPKAFASSGNCFSHRKRMHPLEVERDKERAAQIME